MVSRAGEVHKRPTLVRGVGVNDAPFCTSKHPIYRKWVQMLGRCYGNNASLPSFAAYKDCTVDPVWFSFMAFHDWVVKQDWEGNQLDKDLIVPGNRVYGPEACCFIPAAINMIGPRLDCKGGGVSPQKRGKPFMARINKGDKLHYLGTFNTEAEANDAWKKAKAGVVKGYLADYKADRHDPRVVIALNRIINELEGD